MFSDLSKRTDRNSSQGRALYAHLFGFFAGIDATAQFKQTNIRHSTSVAYQFAICATKKFEFVRLITKFTLRTSGW